MQIEFHKYFKKQYKKSTAKIRRKFDENLIIFKQDPFMPQLNNHSLTGKYVGCRSINITGDIRAVFEIRETGVRFLDIDNHNNLYK
ncbi:MAG: type II toxin-antitoxin system mRNA interferase toxin, RelE/StbE family [bacterium]|nr:type II toxin-antitoxin system mRNA interferase toxin, RelE/StbE family [bacterium]